MKPLPFKNNNNSFDIVRVVLTSLFLASFTLVIAMLFIGEGSHLTPDLIHIIEVSLIFLMFLFGCGIFLNERGARDKYIDDSYKMNEELRKKAVALELCIDGIIIADSDKKLTYMNDAFMRLHGIAHKDIGEYFGQDIFKLYNDKAQKVLNDVAMPELYDTGYWKGELPTLENEDEHLFAETSFTLLPDRSVIASERDITAYKHTYNERIELEKQFFQSQKMEAVGRLAGGMAHDFNNILSSITGYAEFLLEDLDEKSKHYDYAWQIMQGGQQAKKLVEQILTFSRSSEPSIHTMDIVSAVHQTIGMLYPTLPSTIELRTRMDADEVFIDGNIGQVTQNVMNLCINAMDAMEGKSGLMEVKLQTFASNDFYYRDMLTKDMPASDRPPAVRLKDGPEKGQSILQIGSVLRNRDYVCLCISDSGTGMPRDLLDKVFDPFFTTKPVGKGTGLGLASVHGVMAAHKGAIVVTSTVGKGTNFQLYFPMAEGEPGSLGIVHEENNVDPVVLEQLKGQGAILIVDDQEDVRLMVEEMVNRLGYDAASCSSPHDAIDILRDSPDKYSVVLTDHVMPRMTGLELSDAISEDFPDMPVVIFSGYSKQKLQEEMKSRPYVKAVLRKPVDGSTLARALKKALNDEGEIFIEADGISEAS
jgi:signal transduction histidine kinase/CheY-like chemotaxis protein